MAMLKVSLLSQRCLLALVAGNIPSVALAESPWKATGGAQLNVTTGYTTSTPLDYPLISDGAGSLLHTTVPSLNFRTFGNNLYAASATNGGTIQLNGSELVTSGSSAHGANLNNGHLEMSGGSITVSGQNSSGVYGTQGATAELADLAITADGASSSGVTMTTGTLTMANSSILATGAESNGIALAYSTPGEASATLDNVKILLTGEGMQAGIKLGNGTVEGKNLTISSANKNQGVNVYNANGGHGKLTLNDSTITTQDGDAVYSLMGDIVLNNTTINTNNGMGINVNNNSTATVKGGSVTTQGDYADGIWIANKTASAAVDGTEFTTHGSNAIAFDAQYGPATVKNSKMTTSGASAYGLYSESQVEGEALEIVTSGNSAIGVHAARGGSIDLDNVKLATSGNSAAGLLANTGSTIQGKNIQLETTGANSHALWAREGTIELADSTLSASGTSAGGLFASGNTGVGNQVTLDNVALTATQGSAIMTNGTSLDLTLRNGTSLTGGNGILLEDSAVAPDSQVNHGEVNITAENNVSLAGDIRAATENRVTADLRQNSSLTGAVSQLDTLALDNSSRWELTGNSDIGSFSNNGAVNFRHADASFHTLTLESLSGSGSFAMNTDLASLSGDLLVVNGDGTATGNHSLSIKNSGREPGKTDEALTVVDTHGGNAAFTLKGGVVDAGTYQYELQQRGDDWVLAQKHADPNPDPIPTPTTVTALGLFNATPTVWYGELTTLRTRMGEMRDGHKQGGTWVRLIGNRYDVDNRAGVGYQQNQSGISVGLDSTKDIENGVQIGGIFSGYSHSDLDFASDSTGSINSFFIGGYSTWLLNSGWFIDAVAKANNFTSTADVRMSDGSKADGGYSVPGFGASLEVGRQINFENGWFLEPSAQLSALWVKGDSYRFSNDLKADSRQATSKQAALNAVAGHNLTLSNGMTLQPWLRAAVIQEFSDNNAVSINGNNFTNDMSGLRSEYGAGMSSQLSKDVEVYLDARYSKGDKIESPWGGNIGIRWNW